MEYKGIREVCSQGGIADVSSHGWKGVGRYSYQEEKQEKE
jgi:hypothetical protein